MKFLPSHHPVYGFFRSIKYGWQRLSRGYGAYDDRIMWDFDSWFYQTRPAIKDFCVDELIQMNLDPIVENKRYECYQKTLELILKWEKLEWEEKEIEESFPDWDVAKMIETRQAIEEVELEFWGYFGSHISWYWD